MQKTLLSDSHFFPFTLKLWKEGIFSVFNHSYSKIILLEQVRGKKCRSYRRQVNKWK